METKLAIHPHFGAIPTTNGVQFTVWAPDARSVSIFIFSRDALKSAPKSTENNEDEYTIMAKHFPTIEPRTGKWYPLKLRPKKVFLQC